MSSIWSLAVEAVAVLDLVVVLALVVTVPPLLESRLVVGRQPKHH
jgi:hypothetical protein